MHAPSYCPALLFCRLLQRLCEPVLSASLRIRLEACEGEICGWRNPKLERRALHCRADDQHCAMTALVCIENTHNRCGGAVLSLEYMRRLRDWAASKVHPFCRRIPLTPHVHVPAMSWHVPPMSSTPHAPWQCLVHGWFMRALSCRERPSRPQQGQSVQSMQMHRVRRACRCTWTARGSSTLRRRWACTCARSPRSSPPSNSACPRRARLALLLAWAAVRVLLV
jgi:hypothetical protein